jgi:hypothetical protein
MDPLLAGLRGGDEDVNFPATFPSREMIAFNNLVAPRIPSLHFERALIIALSMTKESIVHRHLEHLYLERDSKKRYSLDKQQGIDYQAQFDTHY